MLELSQSSVSRLWNAVEDRGRVKGLTHQFYRYPARFSPQFVRTFIEEFTEPGDLVVDPFVGGGTTLVEAMAVGRRAIGSDINSLATFVTQVKTTPLKEDEIEFLTNWCEPMIGRLRLNRKTSPSEEWEKTGYFRNIDCRETWRYQKLIQIAVSETESLENKRCADFARCAILRTAQLALDGKKNVPPVEMFRINLQRNFLQMLEGISILSEHSQCTDIPSPQVIQASAAEIDAQEVFIEAGKPKLILTSPPYPGVHVLYHRWQVKGRRETPAPYWIANKLDGDGERYYTLGNRHERELKGYFSNLEKAFSSIARLADDNTVIIQMVAFSQPDWQLPKYLEVMKKCGLRELPLGISGDAENNMDDDRMWRDVPNRKWHAEMQATRSGSREVVLCHRKF